MNKFEDFKQLIEVDGTPYRVNVVKDGNKLIVYASPCCLPSAVFKIAEIVKTENCCNEFDFFEAMVFTDPVECIIDCDLCKIIRRALEIYIEDFSLDCDNNNRRGNSCCFFGF